jgi:hypothetical protein
MPKSIVRNVVVGRFLIQGVDAYCVAASTPNKVNVNSCALNVVFESFLIRHVDVYCVAAVTQSKVVVQSAESIFSELQCQM